MPDIGRFVEGFGLTQGMVLAGYQLASLKGGEKTIVRNRRYEYPLTLTFVRNTQADTPQALLQKFKSLTSANRIINSEYGNPYMCHIGNVQMRSSANNTVTITALGTSHRV